MSIKIENEIVNCYWLVGETMLSSIEKLDDCNIVEVVLLSLGEIYDLYSDEYHP